MSEISLDDRGRALENDYFRRKEQELLGKLRDKIKADSTVATEFNCPKCDGKLHQSDYEGIKVDVCDRCGGVWFDAGELAQIMHKDDEHKGFFSRFFG